MDWRIEDVMTREVITVAVDTPLQHVAGLLDREDISAAPVTTDNGRVVGVVSRTDLLADVLARGKRRIRRDDGTAGTVTTPLAEDVMSSPVVSIDPHASLTRAALTMRRHNVRQLVVTDAHGRALGVVSRSDLLRPHTRSDAAIGDEVQQVLRHRLWINPAQVRADVREGAVVLTGTVGRRSTADIAARLTAAVPGVTAVTDRIRFGFDDAELVRSRVSTTHPFSAEPFPSGEPRRTRRWRLPVR
ncbi:CBS domain-containing protein [Actinoplanes sp. NPDC024001]|uniref:CBS domain-containing protein n=1 Tax=Actinoplanes sp. NPDC024001 TaxID=3154598 RepID=UPI00340CA1E0